jgi:hypothetical protein
VTEAEIGSDESVMQISSFALNAVTECETAADLRVTGDYSGMYSISSACGDTFKFLPISITFPLSCFHPP